MSRKLSAIKLDRNQLIDVNEGNKILAYFLGDYSTELFKENAHYYGQYDFEESWDSIMQVVKKIKQIVYYQGYKLLSIEHSLYIKVCNTLYDCDLKGAWLTCVQWCFFYFQHSKTVKELQTLNSEYSVSKKAIKDFQNKCICLPELEVISILTTEKMKSIYRSGNGRFLLRGYDDTFVIVKGNIIERVLSDDEVDIDIPDGKVSNLLEKIKNAKNNN